MALVIVGGTALAVAVITGLLAILSYIHDLQAHALEVQRRLGNLTTEVNLLTKLLTMEDDI